MSIFKTKTYIEVWHVELDKFVEEVYGRSWSYIRSEECNNDSYYTHEVLEEGLDFYSDEEVEEQLTKWLSAEVPNYRDWDACSEFESLFPGAPVILWDLHRKGLIPAGDYLIHVSW